MNDATPDHKRDSREAGHVIELGKDVVFTRFESDGDGVLLNLTTKNYYTLNETAAFIWARLESGSTIESIPVELAAHYDVGTAEAHDSVWELLTDLEKEGLVQIS